jgi:hypothetical protein
MTIQASFFALSAKPDEERSIFKICSRIDAACTLFRGKHIKKAGSSPAFFPSLTRF